MMQLVDWQCDVCKKVFRVPAESQVKCTCDAKQPKLNWVRLVRLLRKPEDKGVGDTVQRIAAKFGGERFKAWAKRIGMPCGCTERQAAWNERWPY